VHWLEHLLWSVLPDALGHDQVPWYLVVGLPVAGAAIVCVARLFLPGDGGHSPTAGIRMSATPWQHAPGIALAAVGTLAFGAVLGPEGPLVSLGGPECGASVRQTYCEVCGYDLVRKTRDEVTLETMPRV
jgi:H+/Cl- antiporter ClcA